MNKDKFNKLNNVNPNILALWITSDPKKVSFNVNEVGEQVSSIFWKAFASVVVPAAAGQKERLPKGGGRGEEGQSRGRGCRAAECRDRGQREGGQALRGGEAQAKCSEAGGHDQLRGLLEELLLEQLLLEQQLLGERVKRGDDGRPLDETQPRDTLVIPLFLFVVPGNYSAVAGMSGAPVVSDRVLRDGRCRGGRRDDEEGERQGGDPLQPSNEFMKGVLTIEVEQRK